MATPQASVCQCYLDEAAPWCEFVCLFVTLLVTLPVQHLHSPNQLTLQPAHLAQPVYHHQRLGLQPDGGLLRLGQPAAEVVLRPRVAVSCEPADSGGVACYGRHAG